MSRKMSNSLITIIASSVALSLSGCVFSVTAVPEESTGSSKRLDQMEARIAHLEKVTVKKRAR